MDSQNDPNQKLLTEAAGIWLAACLRPLEEQATKLGHPFDRGTAKFTWRGGDYEVSLRKL